MRTITIAGVKLFEHKLDCPDCGSLMHLVEFKGKALYKCSRAEQTFCRGCHGAKSDGSPMGTPAHWTVRAVRRKAHQVFDLLWNTGSPRISRDGAYRWLQGAMQLPSDKAHISHFDIEQCERMIRLVKADFGIEPPIDIGEGRTGFFDVSL